MIEPAFCNVTEARPPGLIVPGSNVPPLVAVCTAVSLLMNVTVDPREMVWGFGEYAVVVSANAPATIETDGPPGDVFDVDGAVAFELLLQPTVSVTRTAPSPGSSSMTGRGHASVSSVSRLARRTRPIGRAG